MKEDTAESWLCGQASVPSRHVGTRRVDYWGGLEDLPLVPITMGVRVERGQKAGLSLQRRKDECRDPKVRAEGGVNPIG